MNPPAHTVSVPSPCTSQPCSLSHAVLRAFVCVCPRFPRRKVFGPKRVNADLLRSLPLFSPPIPSRAHNPRLLPTLAPIHSLNSLSFVGRRPPHPLHSLGPFRPLGDNSGVWLRLRRPDSEIAKASDVRTCERFTDRYTASHLIPSCCFNHAVFCPTHAGSAWSHGHLQRLVPELPTMLRPRELRYPLV